MQSRTQDANSVCAQNACETLDGERRSANVGNRCNCVGIFDGKARSHICCAHLCSLCSPDPLRQHPHVRPFMLPQPGLIGQPQSAGGSSLTPVQIWVTPQSGGTWDVKAAKSVSAQHACEPRIDPTGAAYAPTSAGIERALVCGRGRHLCLCVLLAVVPGCP